MKIKKGNRQYGNRWKGKEGIEKMKLTEKNIKVADQIVKILIDEKCTVAEAQEILMEVSSGIKASSTVQMEETYSKKFNGFIEPN